MNSEDDGVGTRAARQAVRSGWSHSERIKKESRHIFNKLHSISQDCTFVRKVASLAPQWLLVANLRCGAWYTDPAITSAVSYFKSTDGHTHQWAFSLKRPNLHLVSAIVESKGCVIVDSTRRGKSMPDALSKTIPIWCAVLNQASNIKYGTPDLEDCNCNLITPNWSVPPSEHDQIQQKIPDFVTSFMESDLEVPKLDSPLRPIFVTPQMKIGDTFEDVFEVPLDQSFIPVVLLSASRLVVGSEDLSDQELDSNRGFVYVQGAGDDHENWAAGLTPDVFWANKDRILGCPKESILDIVKEIAAQQDRDSGGGKHWFTPTGSLVNKLSSLSLTRSPTEDIEVGSTRVFLGSRPSDYSPSAEDTVKYGLIVHISSSPGAAASDDSEQKISDQSCKFLHLDLKRNKKGLLQMRTQFPPAIEAAFSSLGTTSRPILVCCPDGKDLSASLVIAILGSCFDQDQKFIPEPTKRQDQAARLTKDDLKKRLQWLVISNPRASPDRSFLLRVNEILLSPNFRRSASPISASQSNHQIKVDCD